MVYSSRLTSHAEQACRQRASTRVAGALGVAFSALVPGSLAAQESSYCKKVRAKAAADAALMFAPTVHAQGLRFPRNGLPSSTDTQGQDYQVRGMLSFSPLDVYRGTRVRSAAEAECERKDSEDWLNDWIEVGLERIQTRAHRAQLALLDARAEAIEALLEDAKQRLEKRLITITDFYDAMALHGEVMRRRIELRGQIARADVELHAAPVGDLESAKARYQTAAMEVERRLVHLRSLDPWQVFVRGGVVAHSEPDYFGLIEINYNFGAAGRNRHDGAYLEARAAELRTSRREISHRIDVLREQLRQRRKQLIEEQSILENQIALLSHSRTMLESSQLPSSTHLSSLATMREVMLAVDLAYVATLVQELGAL